MIRPEHFLTARPAALPVGSLSFGFLLILLALLGLNQCAAAGPTNSADYAAVDAIFTSHCLDCHGSKDPEGELVLESYQTLLIGGEIGAAIWPGKSEESLLVKMIEGRFEKDGKKK